MKKGFQFDSNRCVGCGACKAGCFIENGWSVSAREIFTEEIVSPSSVIMTNLSLACNHCENAVCLEGCPASCYTRDLNTGAVLIDDDKCLGCKYCTWNCPYDAPKFENVRKIIVKCNFCVSRLSNGFSPSCAVACPTGALSFGVLDPESADKNLKWFPDKKLSPSIEFTGRQLNGSLKIIPGNRFFSSSSGKTENELKTGVEWSLLSFSFFSMVAVSFVGTSLLKGVFPGLIPIVFLLLAPIISSFFHLGRFSRAWRAVANLSGSPLSREILLFLIFIISSLSTAFLKIPWIMPLSAVTGLVFLSSIDLVYTFADNRKQVYLHSGQTFSGTLTLISFASGMLVPFLFIVAIRLSSSLYLLQLTGKNKDLTGVRFFRIAALILSGASLIRSNNFTEGLPMVLLLAGELADRFLFYYDFEPLNIKSSLDSHNNDSQYEK